MITLLDNEKTKMTQNPIKKIDLRQPTHLLAVGFGSGLMPKAPGTWGSLVATPIGTFLLSEMGGQLFFLFTLVSFFLGIYLCQKTAEDMGVHDHGAIVWDEFVGIFITLMALPNLIWFNQLLAFSLFRLFDVWKPFPIKYFDQKIHNGFGIMIDDVIAAFYAVGSIFIYRWFLILFF